MLVRHEKKKKTSTCERVKKTKKHGGGATAFFCGHVRSERICGQTFTLSRISQQQQCPLAVDHGGWLLTENEPVLMVPKTSRKHSEEKGSNSNSWGASSCVLLVCPCPFNCQSAGSDVSNKSDRGRDGWSRAVALKDWVYTSAFINTSTQELPLVPGNNARSFESQ